MVRSAIFVLPLLLLSAAVVSAQGESKDASKSEPKPVGPPPPVVKLRHTTDKLAYQVTIRPGVPEPGTTVTIELDLSEVLSVPDPMYGSRKPINDAELRAVLVAAPTGKGKAKDPGQAEARKAVRLRDAGNYGFTFTGKKGVYGLHILGTTKTAGEVSYSAAVPFGVWPMPEGISHDAPPALPSKEPTAVTGDLEHGKSLCEKRCRTDVKAAYPHGATPTFLRSDFAAALSDKALLEQMLTPKGPKMTILEENDLLYYLRSLHRTIAEFFPDAAFVVSKEFTINEHGKERLKESLNLDLADADATASVFVAYMGMPQPGGLKVVDFDDRVTRSRLKRGDKIGYLVFLDLPKEPKVKELAIAMTREPAYTIDALSARDANGKVDPAINKQLMTFAGKGKFNDPKSLHKGAPALEKKLVPVYMRAAELATMYYGAEREFTEFDAEFGVEEDASVEGGDIKLKQ